MGRARQAVQVRDATGTVVVVASDAFDERNTIVIGEEIGAKGGISDLAMVISCQTLFVQLMELMGVTIKLTRTSDEQCDVYLARPNSAWAVRTIRVSAEVVDHWNVIRQNSQVIAEALKELLDAP